MVSNITIVWTKSNTEFTLVLNIFEFYETTSQFPDPHRNLVGIRA